MSGNQNRLSRIEEIGGIANNMEKLIAILVGALWVTALLLIIYVENRESKKDY